MAALTEPRKTPFTEGNYYFLPIAPEKIIYQGAMVAIDQNGKAVPASAAENLIAAGCAAAVGEAEVMVQRGCWFWENDPASPVTQALVGKSCYMLDDQTVTATSTSSSVAGKVLGFEDGLVIVETL